MSRMDGDHASGQDRDDIVLEVRNLETQFRLGAGIARAVDGVSLTARKGRTLAIVGESGSGKSVTALSLMGLIPTPPARITGGQVLFDGRDLLTLSEREMARLRGKDMAMIFQEPMSSLNPVLSVGHQIAEVARRHLGLSRTEAKAKAIEMLRLVGIPEADRRAAQYPHQLSGGMRQRVMIAIALACNPRLLIADEPTTALDVTIQAQILDLIAKLQDRLDTAVILITHDLGVVAETADHVIVMYAGRKVEEAPVKALFRRPRHPYTLGLMQSVPTLGAASGDEETELKEIPGVVPMLTNLPQGCAFAPRCPFADDRCRRDRPDYRQQGPQHWSACWHAETLEDLNEAAE
jgi:peptide/nickel transport system ATP-binding protein